jgi:pimeloyl-ACP methyl ester carboxylesterase
VVRRILGSSAPASDKRTRERIEGIVTELSRPGALTAALQYYRANASPISRELDVGMVYVPTLVIWGDRAPALGKNLLNGLEDLVPDLRIVRLRPAGHWVQTEDPESVNRHLLDFLHAY